MRTEYFIGRENIVLGYSIRSVETTLEICEIKLTKLHILTTVHAHNYLLKIHFYMYNAIKDKI